MYEAFCPTTADESRLHGNLDTVGLTAICGEGLGEYEPESQQCRRCKLMSIWNFTCWFDIEVLTLWDLAFMFMQQPRSISRGACMQQSISRGVEKKCRVLLISLRFLEPVKCPYRYIFIYVCVYIIHVFFTYTQCCCLVCVCVCVRVKNLRARSHRIESSSSCFWTCGNQLSRDVFMNPRIQNKTYAMSKTRNYDHHLHLQPWLFVWVPFHTSRQRYCYTLP